MKQFKTESKKLLDLMINSIYTNKEIFLRELISNASDALDKLEFRRLTDPALADGVEARITVAFDKDARTITVSDSGIGMDEHDLEENLGTIAHSGSEQFKQQHVDGKNDSDQAKHEADSSLPETLDIIGQFGVGFYSAFMVAERVRVVSRAAGAKTAYEWSSNGEDGYEIAPSTERSDEKDHGTDVILYLKPSTADDDTDHFLSEWTLTDLIHQYSNYIHHPIQMMVDKTREVSQSKDADANVDADVDADKDKDSNANKTPEIEHYQELETINSMVPIWKKRESDVEEKDYKQFYTSTFHDWNDPLCKISFHAEGALSYDALLFIPSSAPFDLYSKDYEKGLALYSAGVLIQEKCADLLPDYFNFVRGVVDSPDISLNISRETLQQNAQLKAIARRVEKKVLEELKRMQQDKPEDYKKFFDAFGRGLKFGIYSSYGTRAEELSTLLLFSSAKEGKKITLEEYVSHMKEGQDKIYYACGEDEKRLLKTPMVASAQAHGLDVLLCTQDVDEFMFQTWRSYKHNAQKDKAAQDADNSSAAAQEVKEFAFTNVSTSGLDFSSDEEKEEAKKAQEEHKDVFEALKKALGAQVKDVRASAELEDAPARICAEGAVSLEMERVLKQSPDASHAPAAERVLELNPKHPVFEKLVASAASHDEDTLELYAKLLLDSALLVEGLAVEDPIEFAKNISKLM